MVTKSGTVITSGEWQASLIRLQRKPVPPPVELYCNFKQVPTAKFESEDELLVCARMWVWSTCIL